jgi:hypothetical protein
MLSGDCNVCINGKLPSYSATCVECGLSRKNYKPITNADRLRAMTDEELETWLVNLCCATTGDAANARVQILRGNLLDWLKQEVSE